MMSLLHLLSFSEILLFKYIHVSPEFLHQTLYSWILDREQSIDMNEMISDSYLVLVVGLIKIFIKHLNKGFFGVQLSLVILRINVDLVTKVLSFGNTHDFTPIS